MTSFFQSVFYNNLKTVFIFYSSFLKKEAPKAKAIRAVTACTASAKPACAKFEAFMQQPPVFQAMLQSAEILLVSEYLATPADNPSQEQDFLRRSGSQT